MPTVDQHNVFLTASSVSCRHAAVTQACFLTEANSSLKQDPNGSSSFAVINRRLLIRSRACIFPCCPSSPSSFHLQPTTPYVHHGFHTCSTVWLSFWLSTLSDSERPEPFPASSASPQQPHAPGRSGRSTSGGSACEQHPVTETHLLSFSEVNQQIHLNPQQ